MVLYYCSQFFTPLPCAIVMPATSISEIYTTTTWPELDGVTYFGHWNDSGHDVPEASTVCVWFGMSFCATVIHHEKNMHSVTIGHRRMMKTHKGDKSMVVIISH